MQYKNAVSIKLLKFLLILNSLILNLLFFLNKKTAPMSVNTDADSMFFIAFKLLIVQAVLHV